MSKLILVMGESGSGKTTSMRNLDPAETLYIDCDKKGLSWKGWRKQYNLENKNYWANSNADLITKQILKISKERPEIKNIIIDTVNGIMIDDEFNRMHEKNFDKWVDMAFSVRGLISMSMQLRDDITVVFTGHTQTERDDSGYSFTRLKTSGKKLDKIVLESMFTVVLYSKCVDGKYLFETQNRNSTAKTPMGMIEEFEVENDITKIIEAMEEF